MSIPRHASHVPQNRSCVFSQDADKYNIYVKSHNHMLCTCNAKTTIKRLIYGRILYRENARCT